MHIRLNTDANVNGSKSLETWSRRELGDKLARFRDRITRIEVHLSDAKAQRVGEADKCCVIEARPAGRRPIAVRHEAGNVADAFHGAAEKLLRALDTVFARARTTRRRRSIRGDAGESAQP